MVSPNLVTGSNKWWISLASCRKLAYDTVLTCRMGSSFRLRSLACCMLIAASVWCNPCLDLKPHVHAGVTAPQEFGGMGMGYSAHCVAMEVRSLPAFHRRMPCEEQAMVSHPCRWRAVD